MLDFALSRTTGHVINCVTTVQVCR